MQNPDARIGFRTNIIIEIGINPEDAYHVPVGRIRYIVLYSWFSLFLIVCLLIFILVPLGSPFEKAVVFSVTLTVILSIYAILGRRARFIIRSRGSVAIGRNGEFPLFPDGKTPKRILLSKPWILRYSELTLLTVQLHDGPRDAYEDIGIYPDDTCRKILQSGSARGVPVQRPELRIYPSDRGPQGGIGAHAREDDGDGTEIGPFPGRI